MQEQAETAIAIPCTQGKFAIVDSEHADYLLGFCWRAKRGGSTWYSHTGHNPMRSMHAMVLMLNGISVPQGKVIDHINGNGLDNRMANLQVITKLENYRKFVTADRYPGVSLVRGRWVARCKCGKSRKAISCKTKEEAIVAYNKMAKMYHGVDL